MKGIFLKRELENVQKTHYKTICQLTPYVKSQIIQKTDTFSNFAQFTSYLNLIYQVFHDPQVQEVLRNHFDFKNGVWFSQK